MIKTRFNFKRSILILVGLLLSIQAYCGESKNDIKKLNNSLIFDLFVNYELTEKNGNLATIIDFFPSFNNINYKNIRLTSNAGGENQVCSFNFNENGTIRKVAYEVNNRIYRYDFVYEGNQLTSINIAGKPKVSFEYDTKGRLLTITRKKGGGAFEYNFEYLKEENKANIKLIVVQGEKRRSSTRKYYVSWNTDLKLESYYFDVYRSESIKYTSQGDLLSYSFASAHEDNNSATWDYSNVDEKQNWIERKYKDIVFNRTIEYK